MPPKNGPMPQDEFLAYCFKFCTEKPRVDFNKLAEAVGMSTGGATNKFRAILKQFEDDGTVSWKTGSSDTGGNGDSPKKSTPTKRKAVVKKSTKSQSADPSADGDDGDREEDGKATATVSNAGVEASDEDNIADQPVKKKARATTTKAAKADTVGKPHGRPKKLTASKAISPSETEIASDDDDAVGGAADAGPPGDQIEQKTNGKAATMAED